MSILEHFFFQFAAEITRSGTDSSVVGTGGQILKELKRTISGLRCELISFTLNDLLLDDSDASDLLDVFVDKCGPSVRYFELVNFTRSERLKSLGSYFSTNAGIVTLLAATFKLVCR